MKTIWLLFVGLAWVSLAGAQDLAESENNGNIADRTHAKVARFVDNTAVQLDSLFATDKTSQEQRAQGSLHVFLNSSWDRYEGFRTTPRVKARVRLPSAKERLYLVLGSDEVENNPYNEKNYQLDDESRDKRLNWDRKQHTGVGLQLERLRNNFKYGVDIGFRRINDPYLRFRASYRHQLKADDNLEVAFLARYGVKSKFYNLNSLRYEHYLASKDLFTNLVEFVYTNQDGVRDKTFSNLTYLTKFLAGGKSVEAGWAIFGDVNNGASINSYGPFMSYQQPVYKDWVFTRVGLNYYNDKQLDRKHYPRLWLQLEIVF